MKLRHLFLAAIVALGMMACNNEDTPQVDGAQSTVSIKVLPSSNGSGVRATGDLNGAATSAIAIAESKITTLEVFLYYNDTLEGYKKVTNAVDGVTEVTGISTKTGPKTIVVVANANIAGNNDSITVLPLSELKSKTSTLPLGSSLPMTGESEEIIVAPGQNQYGYTNSTSGKQIEAGNPLKITRVNARVAIVGAKVDESLAGNTEALLDALNDVEVAMFNVPKNSKIFGAAGSLAVNSDFLYGESWPSPATSYTAYEANVYFKNASITFPITSADAPYYYVNENTATDKQEQMLIVLRGKPTKGGAAVEAEGLYTDSNGYTYYPIWVNNPNYSYDASHTADSRILRNTQYNITLLIKGIGNPTIDPVQDAWLDVMVQVEPWAVVNQDVTWE